MRVIQNISFEMDEDELKAIKTVYQMLMNTTREEDNQIDESAGLYTSTDELRHDLTRLYCLGGGDESDLD